MDISIIIATHNQQERMRLVLCGLLHQEYPISDFEVVVVDDGGTDGTAAMLAEVGRQRPLRVVSLSPNQGRCRARNQGVKVARGDWLAFLDGDALPHPRWLQALWTACQQYGPACLLCGFERSLPDLEYLQDPQRGTPMEEVTPSVVREFIRIHRDELVLTEAMIRDDFAAIHCRSRAGGYPFPALQTVQEQTMELFRQRPDSPLGWMGFYPHNGMMSRKAFVQVSGFDAAIPFSEGWDLAYRLQQAGCKPRFVTGAITYHLYHYHDFSDPARVHGERLTRRHALEHMIAKYQDPRLLLQPFWQAGIWPDPFIPEEMVVQDLLAWDDLYRAITSDELADFQAVIRRHPLWTRDQTHAPKDAF